MGIVDSLSSIIDEKDLEIDRLQAVAIELNSKIFRLSDSILFWKADSAAAWDMCEKYRQRLLSQKRPSLMMGKPGCSEEEPLE